MNILIPTYGRPDQQRTLANLPRPWPVPVALVVRPSEARSHGAGWQAQGVAVLPISHRTTTISATRRDVGRYAESRGLPWFLMMDDDLKVFQRDEDFRLKPLRHLSPMLASIGHIFRMNPEVASVSISARFGNSFCKDSVKFIGRQTQATAYRTKVYNDIYDSGAMKSQYFEDAERTIRLLGKGYRNAILFDYAIEPGRMNTPGGCSTFRTFEGMKADALYMAERYPGIVEYKEKPDPTFWSTGEGYRPDINVKWRRAYKP